jgi:hypothetical protein
MHLKAKSVEFDPIGPLLSHHWRLDVRKDWLGPETSDTRAASPHRYPSSVPFNRFRLCEERGHLNTCPQPISSFPRIPDGAMRIYNS